MAQSPAHKFGQIIGDVLEEAVEPLLSDFAQRHNLYLDKKGRRPARRGSKVSWTDEYGNTHDLDYVLERGGSAEKVGTPVAFIETAWRRYTKHSRNKAQEIQGAILSLVTTHRNAAPFIGVVLAGVFTEGALEQLRSLGFTILYFPYSQVIAAFQTAGLDARFQEDTPDAEFARRVRAWEDLPDDQRVAVTQHLVESNLPGVQRFMRALERAMTRTIKSVRVLPLHGSLLELGSIEEAIELIRNYDESCGPKPIVRYAIEIHYSNGDHIKAEFGDKKETIDFLLSYSLPALRPT